MKPILDRLRDFERSSDDCAIIFELQRRFGLRWSECKALKFADIIDREYIRFQGSKGSYDRFEFCPDIIAVLARRGHPRPSASVFSINYGKYYRFVKSRVPYRRKPGKKNAIVTHQARHNLVQKMANKAPQALSSVSRRVGHKSNKTLSYYLQEVKHG